MKRILKLIALGSVCTYAAARLLRRTSAPTHSEPPELWGMADVDPEPLTQFGEAVDPEAIRDAHARPALLHDRLPRRGKNLP